MKKLIACMLAALAALIHLPAAAEDIDLFASPPTTLAYLPNVLIVIDNTANWNTVFTNEKAALRATFNALPLDKFRIGMLMFTETGAGNSNPDGGYVRAAIRTMDATTRPKYATWINSLDVTNDKGNSRGLGLAMAESYKYFAGQTAYAGHNKVKRDHAGNTSGTAGSNGVYALAGNAFNSSSSTTYVSPVQDGCQRNFVIYIGNTTAGGNVTKDNTSDNSTAGSLLTAAGGDATQVTDISPSGFSDNYADEWTRFMKKSALGITTYTVDVSLGSAGNGPDNTGLLKSMASQGGGKYFYINGNSTTLQEDIEKALATIFSEIQSVNSVFASVSLPVSVNMQGSYLNQVYIGMFRPDVGAAPRWGGNLKQYKLGLVGSNLKLQDADSASAINNQSGFITECARSFWTPNALDTYWSWKAWPNGTSFCIPPGGSPTQYEKSNWPDGNIVEKGAQGYRLRSTANDTANRFTYTCSGTSMAGCATMMSLIPANLSTTTLAVSTSDERDALVNWARGQDVDSEDLDTNVTETRASAHGDVVHSRPVAVNFDDTATTAAASKVVVFYGGNDGLLRAINGNRTADFAGKVAGQELWSFMPPEAYGHLKRLRANTQLVKLNGETYGAGADVAPKPYSVDGPITAFKGAVGGVDKIFIYATLRRGGRSVYAFDVTNMLASPTAPTFKWRIGCSTSLSAATQDCSAGMSNLGQTWSSLKSFTTAGHGGGATNLLIFGGGYDTCEDHDAGAADGANHNCTGTSKGGSVYVVDADTGAVVKEFVTGFSRGVIADVTLVRDATNQVILGYTADLGGNVYRIKFGNGPADSWTMDRIAALGCDTPAAACAANRKFFFAPSVVTTDVISMNATYHVMLGSGDREKPISFFTAANAVQHNFYQFKDKPGDSTWPGNADCGANLICMASLYAITTAATPTPTQLAGKKGWALRMGSTEQVVTSAVTVFGVVTFSTHKPAGATNGCSANLGETKVYNINFANAGPVSGDSRSEDVAGDGLPPSPVAGQVTLDDGTTVPFCIGCSKDSPLEGKLPTSLSAGTQPKGRLYWYVEK